MSQPTHSAQRLTWALWRYCLPAIGVAAVMLIIALMARLLRVTPVELASDVLPLFYAVVIVSAWLGGIGPGLLAVVLATLAIDYMLKPPVYQLTLHMTSVPGLIGFAVSALVVVWLTARRRDMEDALRHSRAELEIRVRERTADLARTNEQLRAEAAERTRAEEERERLLVREQAARAEAVAAQQRFRDLVNSLEGIVWEADARTLQFSFVSKQAEHILGYPVDHWLSKPTFWKEHIHPDDRDRALDTRLTATAKGEDHDFEYRLVAADGRSVWLRDLVTVLVEQDQPTRLRGPRWRCRSSPRTRSWAPSRS